MWIFPRDSLSWSLTTLEFLLLTVKVRLLAMLFTCAPCASLLGRDISASFEDSPISCWQIAPTYVQRHGCQHASPSSHVKCTHKPHLPSAFTVP